MTSPDTLTPDPTERDADEAAFIAWADDQAEREFSREQAYRAPREEVREYAVTVQRKLKPMEVPC